MRLWPHYTRTGRASSSYVLWVDGRSRLMVDAGGGSFLRFGESGAQLADLDLLALSHFHPDHVSDLPAILWGDRLRQEPLRIAGPSGNEAVPALNLFLSRLFDPEDGADRPPIVVPPTVLVQRPPEAWGEGR